MDNIEQAHWHDVNYDYVAEMTRAGKERLVASAVIVSNGNVLLVRRSLDDSYPGMWEFPGGGVDVDESLVDAIRREVEEETSIVLPALPRGEVLSHPTRTALRVVMRFDLDADYVPEVVLSTEHDLALWVSSEGSEETEIDGVALLSLMRPENQGILSVVTRGPCDQGEVSQ